MSLEHQLDPVVGTEAEEPAGQAIAGWMPALLVHATPQSDLQWCGRLNTVVIDVSAASQRSSGTWTRVLIVQPTSTVAGGNGSADNVA